MDDNGCCSPTCQSEPDDLYEDNDGNWYCGFCLLEEHNRMLPGKMEQASQLVDDLVRRTLNLTEDEKKLMLQILGPTT